MSWRAKVYDSETGRFLVEVNVRAADMRTAEDGAISKACFALRGDPKKMLVRELHGYKERGGHAP